METNNFVVANNNEGGKKFRIEMSQLCPGCKIPMKYIYGETYECPSCGRKELSDFGKVRAFLDEAGPQPALVISSHTGVSVTVIEGFLREGRVEIPDGSSIYIKCQSCGTEIRYGRYCPECVAKTTKNLTQAMLAPEVGEKPRYVAGKMHTLDSRDSMKIRGKRSGK